MEEHARSATRSLRQTTVPGLDEYFTNNWLGYHAQTRSSSKGSCRYLCSLDHGHRHHLPDRRSSVVCSATAPFLGCVESLWQRGPVNPHHYLLSRCCNGRLPLFTLGKVGSRQDVGRRGMMIWYTTLHVPGRVGSTKQTRRFRPCHCGSAVQIFGARDV